MSRRRQGPLSQSMSVYVVTALFFQRPGTQNVAAGTQTIFPIGFCRDRTSTDGISGTGFAEYSTTTEADCPSGLWCGLRADTRTWVYNGNTIRYYLFSVCCQGKQLTKLKIDTTTGLPTCANNRVATTCKRIDWHNKLMDDLVNFDTSGYRNMVAPSSALSDPRKYYTVSTNISCACQPTDSACERVSNDGQFCLVCNTDTACSDTSVEVSINFFKIHSVNLKTSKLSLAVWMRQSWQDQRLSYDYQCYGGLDFFEVLGEAGVKENTQVWVPDMELYNAETSVWKGSLHARTISVYSCSDQAPTRGGCGYVFFSRPGIMEALCKYMGLVTFPYDKLACRLEFGAWSLDGRFQDIQLKSTNGGVEWLAPDSTSVTGLTAGSRFQDYGIINVRAARKVVLYSQNSAFYPELLYLIEFQRSRSFYVVQLVFPGCLLTVLSFIAFWMNPAVTDRLGFGITVMLAMITNQIVAVTYMPVCEEKVLFDYMSISFIVFGALSLLETGVVLYIHQLKCEDWFDALVPRWIPSRPSEWRKWFDSLFIVKKRKTRTPKRNVHADKGAQLRRQLYNQIFYAIDVDFNGTLGLEEIDAFGYFIAGGRWKIAEAEAFLKASDENWDGVLDFEEFADFCELNLLAHYQDDPSTLKQMIKGFLVLLDKKKAALALMWKMRALQLDQFCRWAIPPGFAFFMMLSHGVSEDHFDSIKRSITAQIAMILSGLYPIMFIILAYCTFYVIQNYIFTEGDERKTGRFLRHHTESAEQPEYGEAAVFDAEERLRLYAAHGKSDDIDDIPSLTLPPAHAVPFRQPLGGVEAAPAPRKHVQF